jgi:hypothetical protein
MIIFSLEGHACQVAFRTHCSPICIQILNIPLTWHPHGYYWFHRGYRSLQSDFFVHIDLMLFILCVYTFYNTCWVYENIMQLMILSITFVNELLDSKKYISANCMSSARISSLSTLLVERSIYSRSRMAIIKCKLRHFRAIECYTICFIWSSVYH